MNSSTEISTSDFNKKLMEMLCAEEEEEEYCLISNVELEEDHVKLVCGHKFNYSSIFKEVCSQKRLNNHYETQRLSKNQIKCPYCRNIQNGLLISKEGYDNINYVNWPVSLQYKPNKCAYVFLSGKRKNQICGVGCSSEYCKNHERIMTNRMKKQEKAKLAKEKVKLEKENMKLVKENVKLKNKKAKLKNQSIDMLKKIKKIAKEKVKENNKKNHVIDFAENLIIDLTGDVEVYDFTGGVEPKPVCATCQYKFKRGKNKGKCCPVKKITNGYCKKHIKYSSQPV